MLNEKGRDGVTRKRVVRVDYVECDCVETPRCAHNCACECHYGRSVVMPLLPMRNRLDEFTPAELAIYEACSAVEKIGAHPLLTEVVVLLAEARECLSAFLVQSRVADERASEET